MARNRNFCPRDLGITKEIERGNSTDFCAEFMRHFSWKSEVTHRILAVATFVLSSYNLYSPVFAAGSSRRYWSYKIDVRRFTLVGLLQVCRIILLNGAGLKRTINSNVSRSLFPDHFRCIEAIEAGSGANAPIIPNDPQMGRLWQTGGSFAVSPITVRFDLSESIFRLPARHQKERFKDSMVFVPHKLIRQPKDDISDILIKNGINLLTEVRTIHPVSRVMPTVLEWRVIPRSICQ